MPDLSADPAVREARAEVLQRMSGCDGLFNRLQRAADALESGALEPDSRRLDWLDDRTDRRITVERKLRDNYDYWWVTETHPTRGKMIGGLQIVDPDIIARGSGRTLRQAIDAAIRDDAVRCTVCGKQNCIAVHDVPRGAP